MDISPYTHTGTAAAAITVRGVRGLPLSPAAAIPSDTTKFDDYDTIRNDSGRMVRRIAAGSLRKFGAG